MNNESMSYNMTQINNISESDTNKNINGKLHIQGTEGIIYLFLNIFCIFYYFIPLIW